MNLATMFLCFTIRQVWRSFGNSLFGIPPGRLEVLFASGKRQLHFMHSFSVDMLTIIF